MDVELAASGADRVGVAEASQQLVGGADVGPAPVVLRGPGPQAGEVARADEHVEVGHRSGPGIGVGQVAQRHALQHECLDARGVEVGQQAPRFGVTRPPVEHGVGDEPGERRTVGRLAGPEAVPGDERHETGGAPVEALPAEGHLVPDPFELVGRVGPVGRRAAPRRVQRRAQQQLLPPIGHPVVCAQMVVGDRR